MSNIKQNLKDLVKHNVIPEVEAYLDDLHKLLENNTAKEDDLETIKEMESFLVELENILLIIKEDKLSQEEALETYNKIITLIDTSTQE